MIFRGKALAEFKGFFGQIEAFFGDVFSVKVVFRLASLSAEIGGDFVGAIFGASREVGQALERQKLGGCVVAGGSEVVGGVHDGGVNVVGD